MHRTPRLSPPPSNLRLAASLAAGLFALVALSGCFTSQRNTEAYAPRAAWQNVTIPGTGAVMRVPGQPRWEYERGFDDDGAQMQSTTGMASYGSQAAFGAVVLAVQGTLLGRPIDALAAMHREFVEGEHRQQRAFSIIEDYGFTGFDGVYEDTREQVLIFVRAYVGRQRSYAFMAFVQTEAATAHRPIINEFLRGARPDATDAPFVSGDGVLRTDAWRWVYPPITGFAAEFPGAPRMAEYPSTLEGAAFKRSYTVQSADGASFEVRATGFSEQTPDNALELIEVPPTGYTLRHASDSTRQGFPARVVVYESQARLRFHIHVKTARRLLEASVDLPRASGQALLPARTRFFNSFRVN